MEDTAVKKITFTKWVDKYHKNNQSDPELIVKEFVNGGHASKYWSGAPDYDQVDEAIRDRLKKYAEWILKMITDGKRVVK